MGTKAGGQAAQTTHTFGVDDIVEGELGDQRVELEEEGQGLADTTCESGKWVK